MEPSVQNPIQQGMPSANPDGVEPVSSSGVSADALAQAIERVETIIAQTTADPAERAQQIQTVKDAYLQSTYNVTRPGSQKQ